MSLDVVEEPLVQVERPVGMMGPDVTGEGSRR
jgi:hypothetical protein